MVETVFLGAVAYKLVSAILIVGSIEYRTAVCQFVVYDVSPLLQGKGVPVYRLHQFLVVTEIVGKVPWLEIGTRCFRIVHLHAASAVQHQGGYGVFLLIRIIVSVIFIVVGQHLVPFVLDALLDGRHVEVLG